MRIFHLSSLVFEKDPVNKATGVPETLDLLHQQFSDTAENKPLEGYVVDVKDSFVKVTGVSSASIGGTVTFENGMKGSGCLSRNEYNWSCFAAPQEQGAEREH